MLDTVQYALRLSCRILYSMLYSYHVKYCTVYTLQLSCRILYSMLYSYHVGYCTVQYTVQYSCVLFWFWIVLKMFWSPSYTIQWKRSMHLVLNCYKNNLISWLIRYSEGVCIWFWIVLISWWLYTAVREYVFGSELFWSPGGCILQWGEYGYIWFWIVLISWMYTTVRGVYIFGSELFWKCSGLLILNKTLENRYVKAINKNNTTPPPP